MIIVKILISGVLDQLEGEKNPPRITASLFLPIQGRLACGRDDGSIILVPATETIILHLLHGKHHEYHSNFFSYLCLFKSNCDSYLLYIISSLTHNSV